MERQGRCEEPGQGEAAVTIIGRRPASIKALTTIKDVTPEDAKEIRRIWLSVRKRQEARDAIDTVLRTFGVEYLGIHRTSGEDTYYCNAGDTYATTVVFIGKTMRVACWGDYIERNLVKERTQP